MGPYFGPIRALEKGLNAQRYLAIGQVKINMIKVYLSAGQVNILRFLPLHDKSTCLTSFDQCALNKTKNEKWGVG